FILLINSVVPISLTGGVGAKTVGLYDYVGALKHLVGSGATNFFVVVMVMSFVMSMNTATADGSRALFGISRDGLTIKELGRLNRSEEHTSELQSQSNLVCRLLLEKKN